MRMYDILEKKKHGEHLSTEEIRFFVNGYTSGEIPDYQASAFTMAVCLQGMSAEEAGDLTLAMRDSGDVFDLSEISGFKVDKHSTGGVGDKTTLIAAPIVAACGGIVAKLSGRGLGHTGGTLDKLESVPGVSTSLSRESFFDQVNKINLVVAGQTGNLVPADKKLYALRDVTATVDSIPLIASSIMSKKLAAGCDGIVLDVKTGSGAFMKKLPDSIALAEEMVNIGRHAGKKVVALITDMDQPLGNAVGNLIEVKEAVAVLEGQGPEDLTTLCTALAGKMLEISGKGDYETCKAMAAAVINNGSGLAKLKELIAFQGGDVSALNKDMDSMPLRKKISARKSGYITGFDTEGVGLCSVLLGAGREKKEDELDFTAGIYILKKKNDYVLEGEAVAYLYGEKVSEDFLNKAEEKFLESIFIGEEKTEVRPLIFKEIN